MGAGRATLLSVIPVQPGKSPGEISYRGDFDITIAGDPHRIASVVMLRSDHDTHSLTTGDRYVKLAFRRKGDRDDDDRGDDRHDGHGRHGHRDHDSRGTHELRVTAPNVPAQAIPGIYMLFVVDQKGVPSVGRKLVVKAERRGKRED
ncbi:MAG: galactose oxidase early set domain-containing protein [Gammaproteobacteria bacterium]